ncbi:MAG: AraC family transcriptional regulator [Treponema sp.]|jgi:AraC-like DNA-binding protein|nr:AraC family transcriptional regulator [Treponema sp.]
MKDNDIQDIRAVLSNSAQAELGELVKYSDVELFYQRWYELREDDNALRKYLSALNLEEWKARCFVPDPDQPDLLSYHGIVLTPQNLPIRLTENEFFVMPQTHNRDIILQKHDRYSPVFLHTHEFFEIFYVLSGQCVSAIGDNRSVLSAGKMCFIAPNTVHTMEVFDDSLIINFIIRKSTFDEFFFNILTMNNILSHFFIGSLFFPRSSRFIIFDTGRDGEMLRYLFDILLEQKLDDPYSNRIMENQLEIFFSLLVRKDSQTPVITRTAGEDHWGIIAYIHEKFRTITLSKTAKQFNFSVPYCSRLIKSLAGKNFTALVRDIRIMYAKKLLSSSNERMYDISYSLGFENQETFIRTFKKSCGMTPTQFRETGQQSD